MAVLLLNATYEPLQVISLRRALILVLIGKAELVEASSRLVNSPSLALPEPLVIRLLRRVRTPQRFDVPLSRSAVLARDEHTCQYCGERPGRHLLTVDHVLPQSRGGGWSWTNLVAACPACNARKADRTPEEAGMALLRPPRKSHYVGVALLSEARQHPAWRPYLWSA